MPTTDTWLPMYIDGELHHVTQGPLTVEQGLQGGRFFADSPELPYRRCSQYWFSAPAVAHLRAGGTVGTVGHTYSFTPKE